MLVTEVSPKGSTVTIISKNGVLFHWLKYDTLGVLQLLHCNVSVKPRIIWKQFDLCIEILVATMAICYANTAVETFSLYPLFHI